MIPNYRRDPPRKVSRVEKLTNFAIIALFSLEILVTLICSIAIGAFQTTTISKNMYVFKANVGYPEQNSVVLAFEGLITFFILFNNFIPIR